VSSPYPRPYGVGMKNAQLTSSFSPYLTLKEAALYARCSTRTVQRWLDAGTLRRYGHGRRPLILKGDLETLLSTSPGT
jgi:excisionase family DNA binding protein